MLLQLEYEEEKLVLFKSQIKCAISPSRSVPSSAPYRIIKFFSGPFPASAAGLISLNLIGRLCNYFQIRGEPGAGQFADGGGAGAVDAAGAAPRPVAASLAGRARRVHRGRQRAVRGVHRRGPALGGALASPLLLARHQATRPPPARRRLGPGAAAGGAAARHRR